MESPLPRAALMALLLTVTIGYVSAGGLAQSEDTAFEAELERIARETAALRELPPLASVDDVLLSRDELQTMMPAIMTEELDIEETEAQSRALAALGLIPADTDLFALNVQLMGEQAMGFYDPLTDEMIVVADGDLGVTEYFYAHEIVHALQDAHLDPDDFLEDRTALNSDEALAALALFEGDAVAASNAYLAEHPSLALALLREVQIDFPELEQAPAAIGVALVFPYTEGLAFVERLRAEGGWDAVDAAYTDVPTSTEQILHPRKYLDRDDPSTVTLPDLAVALGQDWSVVAEDTLGELQTALLLANFAPGEGFTGITGNIDLPEAARNAAAGWDGDRFALWEDASGEREILVWRSVWDTPQDARAFSRALAQFGNERGGGVFNGESPDDITLVASEVAARILLDGQDILYVQAP
ncbi:MAG: hypothetical protein ACRDJC_23485, partial [Thermomicrobiales bacterium]